MKTLEFNYTFKNSQRDELYQALESVKIDPYIDVELFKMAIGDLIASNNVPTWFEDICAEWREMDKMENPEFLLKNVPVDENIPVLDFRNPVLAKYRLKKTSITESFLELFAQLCHQESIGYKFVNTGDIYQDIHPMEKLKNTQSQKSIVNLGFHKDLANHFVRPDYVNIICLRNDMSNNVYTTFVRNIDLLNYLEDIGIMELLKEEMYYTPYDALTKHGDAKGTLGKAKNHTIVYDNDNIAFFEGRTEGVTPEHQRAVDLVVDALHKLKRGHHFGKGDFISSENNKCIHGKEIASIGNPDKLKERWLMKTVNVNDIKKHEAHLMEGKKFIING